MIITETTTCLNLCEICRFPDIETVIDKIKDNYSISRIYIGSYFCGNYFQKCNYDELIDMLTEAFTPNINITLVIPVPTERNLKDIKTSIINILNKYSNNIDEITINDYGMLEYMYEFLNTNPQLELNINMGRIFFKDYRDPRYDEYFNSDHTPKYNTHYLRKTIRKYNIKSIEADVTHKSFILPDIEGIIVGIHTPYTYMTTGKICEYASQFKEITKKFRPSVPCNTECNNVYIKYNMNDNRKWIRIGKTIFFENNCFKLSNINIDSKKRLIYFPLNEIIGKVCN